MRIKKMIALGLAVIMTASMSGCAKKKEDIHENKQVTSQESVKDTEPQANTTDRIIASSVSIVQILDALGIPMVGVPTSSYELPESVADVTRIGRPMEPDMEVIASLDPTVVLSVDSLSKDMKSQFDELGIESSFVSLSSYDQLKKSIQQLGERFGATDKATELVSNLEDKEKQIIDYVVDKESPKVLIIFGAGQSFMVASEESYTGSLAKKIGATNVLQDAKSSFSPVDLEYLADANPDYILLMAHANPEESLAALKEEFNENAAWQNFDAVKNDKVIALDTNYFGMTANLLAADAMKQLADIIYAE